MLVTTVARDDLCCLDCRTVPGTDEGMSEEDEV